MSEEEGAGADPAFVGCADGAASVSTKGFNRGEREYLLLASYCGNDNDACNNKRPCPDCLAMCNVFDEHGKFVRELGSGGGA